MEKDELILGDYRFTSRFFLGSGKTARYSQELINTAVDIAGVQMISVAIKTLGDKDNVLNHIPEGIVVLPNTLGATSADEAISMARRAREKGLGTMVKIEIMNDSKYLLPDNKETIKATDILAKEGFKVLPYIYPSLSLCRKLVEAGAIGLMPLASPSGSNKGLATRDYIQALIKEMDVPIIVEAGIGKLYQTCEAIEIGSAEVM